LARQVLPVWRRNVEAARGHSDTAMGALLERFASVSAQLDVALSNSRGATLAPGADDQLLAAHQPELDTLLATTTEVVAQRDQALATTRALGQQLQDLHAQAREVQAIGRATHLLALNASVEATRASAGAGNAFAVVAQQVRHLADQSRQAGTRMAQRVQAMQQRLAEVAAAARRSDTSAPELALRAQDSARAVVRSLVGGLAEVSRSSRTLRDASRQIQTDIDDIMVSLQSQDRLSQMLTSVTGDMVRLEALQAGQDDPDGDTVVKWLERLDASYPMEEMRSSHHGAVRIEQSASVEFF
jgi:methyl-accepting chemotaxis protein